MSIEALAKQHKVTYKLTYKLAKQHRGQMMVALSDVLQARKAQIAADNALMAKRPAGCPRAAWRGANSTAPVRIEVRDTRFKTRPKRMVVNDVTAVHDVMVVAGERLVERIDLRAPDAQERLDRYIAV